ncbi:MAG: hypothetical protein ACHQZQ_03215 [SAR324 cluster bacterium]
MLEIDYSLVALGEQDRAAIVAEVARKIKAGVVPTLDKTKPGKVVVLNPDPVQTVHHVPDELRVQIRRGLVSTTEGSIPLRAERLFADVVGGTEPLVALIIEVQTDFPALGEFLDYIPALRARFPDCAVFLNGTVPNIMEKFRQVLSAGRTTLTLSYPDARGTLDIDDPDELSLASSATERGLTFTQPFFSQIRIVMDKSGKAQAFNFEGLRKLHGVFGHGEAKEVDLGGGRKDRVVVVDIPMRLIRDMQFRQDRGLEFHGIVQEKRTILSRHFEQEKLELKMIPMRSIEAFLKKAPGQDVERVDVAKAKVLRVNCFNGQVTLLTTQQGNQISLQDAKLLAIRRRSAPKLKMPEGWDAPRAGVPSVIQFDKVVLPGTKLARLEPIQQAVQEHFYARLLMGEATQTRKQDAFARRLKVGAVGPLAAQTIKLLRRFGLERLIDAASFHYVCDQPAQLPTYTTTPQRYSQHFDALVAQIKEIAQIGQEHNVRLNDINHRLPICTEWIDADRVSFETVSAEDLGTVYHELGALSSFIGHEFQSTYDLDRDDLEFFEKIRICRTAALLAKWLSEYRRGTYGSAFQPNQYPDVVFLGTAQDKEENDTRYFFPSLACSELFQDPDNRKLFSKIDYEFSVFLEEQLAMGDHQARQEGHANPQFEQIAGYLEQRQKEAERERDVLTEQAMKLDSADSPEYQAILKEEEEAYHDRYRAYLADREKVAVAHQELDARFFDLVRNLHGALNLPPDPDPGWLAGDEPDPGCVDRPILAALKARRNQLQPELERNAGAVSARIREALTLCHEIAAAKLQLLQSHRQWQNAILQRGLAEGVRQVARGSAERIALARRTPAGDLENHLKHAQSQLTDIEGELRAGESQMVTVRREQARTLQQIQRTAAGLISHMDKTAHAAPDLAASLNLAPVLAQRAGQIEQLLAGLKAKREEWMQQSASSFLRRQRLTLRRFEIGMDAAVLKALVEGRTPQPLEPSLAEPPKGLEALEREFSDQVAHLDALHPRLAELTRSLGSQSGKVRGQHRLFLQFEAQRDELEKLSAKKARMRKTAVGLNERRSMMDADLADLPTRLREQFIPARKKLLLGVFIPDLQKRIYYFRQANAFLGELLNLPYERVRQLYLDRAIFRRFSSHQFVYGLQVTHDAVVANAAGLRNVNAAISQYFRTLQYNYGKSHPKLAPYLKLDKVAALDPPRILARLRMLPAEAALDSPSYLILPSTLPMPQAVKLMNQKDALFLGVPRCVLVYIGKFDAGMLQADGALRDEYFQALRHNVIVNIDDKKVVDNPRTIALRLLDDTLGCAFDTTRVDEIPEEAQQDEVQVVRG